MDLELEYSEHSSGGLLQPIDGAVAYSKNTDKRGVGDENHLNELHSD